MLLEQKNEITVVVDMITAFGHVVDYKQPKHTIVDPEDLRIHTRNMCRYNGALDWKLVQHLSLCARLIEVMDEVDRVKFNISRVCLSQDHLIQQGYAVAHDLHEIYVGDVVSGLKKHLPEYRKIENIWEEFVHEQIRLLLAQKNNKLIKHVDIRALVIEMTVLGHPAAEYVQSKYGGVPTSSELHAMYITQQQSLDDCWKHSWYTLNRAVKLLYPTTEELQIF